MDKLKRAVIKEELVELTGDYKLALTLQQLLYWTERVGFDRYNKWREEESTRSIEEIEDLKGGWIHKATNELIDELMIGVAESTMGRYLDKIIDMGYLLKRRNPKFKWDKTYQYRINLINIVTDLDKLGYHLEGYKYDDLLEPLIYSNFHNENSKFQYEISDCDNERALPETTIESTTENTKNLYTQLKLYGYETTDIYNNLYENEFNREHPKVLTEKLPDMKETLLEIKGGYGTDFYINMIKYHFNECIYNYEINTAASKSKLDYFVTVKDRYLLNNLDDIGDSF